MSQETVKKEALFNEVKGSLFEYLVARQMSRNELGFLETIPKNYMTILSQQDRMVRQFYPEMLPFLKQVSDQTSKSLRSFIPDEASIVNLIGKCSAVDSRKDNYEADMLIKTDKKIFPVSLKLNKQNAFVNTKSGGIKSFFSLYFPFLPTQIQDSFNAFVDQEFFRMAHELHALNDMTFEGSFSSWVKAGKSELPGELSPEERSVLKHFYRRVASRMHEIFLSAESMSPEQFRASLALLMGFGSADIIQVVCFHEFGSKSGPDVRIHTFEELQEELKEARVTKFGDISSVEIDLGNWRLQIRVKPMNKFTTTAIKINCSVKF